MKTATQRWAALLLFLLAGPLALAQDLGDEFIFFADGANILIPNYQGVTVNDPLAPTSGNKVAKFNAGAYTHAGFAWSQLEGVDASQMIGESYGESDTLYLRLLSDPANAEQQNVRLMFTDKTDNSPANDGTADLEFRATWDIPPALHDGQWHDLAIPLPPATYAALEAARANGELDPMAEPWMYPGAWSSGGFGVGPAWEGNTDGPLWKEFEWDAMYRFGPQWDNAVGGGPIYLDNVYIGGPNTDIAAATEMPSAMSGVSFTAEDAVNAISWTPQDEFGGYNVYASDAPITDVSAEGVILLRRVRFDDDPVLVHRYEVPHPSLGEQPLYYAVTSLSAFGVENPDVSASAGQVINPTLPQKPYIRQLTSDQADALFEAISNGTATDAGFPEDQPVFVFDSSHRSPGDGTTEETLPTDQDLSARVKVGYSDLNELYIYAEVTDDTLTLAPVGTEGGGTWNYDSFEFVFGHYDVRDTDGGGIIVGSPHQDMSRGDEPDYGFRITAIGDENGDVGRISTWIGWSIDTDFEGATAFEATDTGYKLLSIIPLNQIQSTDSADVFMPVPASDEVQYLPVIFSLNDADGETRESQIVWSIKPNVTGQWWNTPAMWETVAMAGMNVVAAEQEGPAGAVSVLRPSAPNPAAGQARIAFQLGSARHATLEVFNTLGQRVATLAEGHFAAGPHEVTFDTRALASGVYVYRLTAGDFVATRRMTVIR